MVVFVVGEVDRASRDLHPIRQRGLVYVMTVIALAAKRWNERGMDVHGAADELVRHPEQAHETRHDDEVNGIPVKLGGNRDAQGIEVPMSYEAMTITAAGTWVGKRTIKTYKETR